MPDTYLVATNLQAGITWVRDDPNVAGGAVAMKTIAVPGAALVPLPDLKIAPALNATTGSLPAGAITGAKQVFLTSTNATPGAQLVRTAAQMLADMLAVANGAVVGTSWRFRITNTGAGVFTLTTDAGATVTLSGTMTIAQNTWRDFVGTIVTATTATITQVGTGANS